MGVQVTHQQKNIYTYYYMQFTKTHSAKHCIPFRSKIETKINQNFKYLSQYIHLIY